MTLAFFGLLPVRHVLVGLFEEANDNLGSSGRFGCLQPLPEHLDSQVSTEASLLTRSRHHVTLGMGPVPLTGVRAGTSCGILEVLRVIHG